RVADKDGEHGLLPIHATLDQTRGKHVRQDVHRHRDPQRGVVVGGPASASRFDGSQVVVVEWAGFDVCCAALLWGCGHGYGRFNHGDTESRRKILEGYEE